MGGDDGDIDPFAAHEGINEFEDAVSVGGVALQEVGGSTRDKNALIWRDADGYIKAKDPEHTNPIALLASLNSQADLDGGPGEGYAAAHKEVYPAGSLFPTRITWWTDANKTHKIVEKTIDWSGGYLTPTPVTWTSYKADGSTSRMTITDVITYSGVFEVSRERTIT